MFIIITHQGNANQNDSKSFLEVVTPILTIGTEKKNQQNENQDFFLDPSEN